jgi:hypothetical protein
MPGMPAYPVLAVERHGRLRVGHPAKAPLIVSLFGRKR